MLVDCPVCRFWIIGDGPLRTQLQELVNRLEISWAVKFLGWISSQDLPEVLSKISILVNPSLRAWSETFCIANIEAMAMRIPIVTFAVGGIGEYIRQPLVSGNKLYTVGPNAIILNNASPLAISEAVMVLIRNKTLRLEIGDNAYETVRAQFTVSSQIKLYEQLYSFLTNK